MKKVLTALIMFVAALSVFSLKADAADEKGNLVIHYHSWSEDYTELGSHAWGGPAAGKVYDGIDEFGAYWNYNDIPVGTEVGFIAVTWPGGAGPDWNMKKTEDVMISPDAVKAGKTTHVYVFEGAASTKDGDKGVDGKRQAFVADPDKKNMLVVYYDPTGNYEETIGMHFWDGFYNGEVTSPAWGTPVPFETAGKYAGEFEVKAIMLTSSGDKGGGLIYDGTNKKTGDIVLDPATVAGGTDIAYVVGVGTNEGVTNVYRDFEEFSAAAFAFGLVKFDNAKMTGTYATSPSNIVVKTSQPVENPYKKAQTKLEKAIADATVKSWFTVREDMGEGKLGTPLIIDRVDYAQSNDTISDFVIVLRDGSTLDMSKDYVVEFDLGIVLPTEKLAAKKEVEVRLVLTVPENTPVDAVISAAGAFNGWTPGAEGYTVSKIGNKFVLSFVVEVDEAITTFEYKWTRGEWASAEFIEENRKLVILNTQDFVTFEDEVLIWEDLKAEDDEKYAAPNRAIKENLSASIAIDIDNEAPVFTFLTAAIAGKPAAQRIIEVAWGKPFDQNLFPSYRVTDNRDGDLTTAVYVPKGANSVINTSVVGDYTIMLQVEDKWGNVAQETFIFRVVKK